mmetsp:Transcript_71195/g.123570  ORF Transcript_71195/g.123570 Transcript_71195/m.123570 type:complete len:330 (-) Transcript_71195:75-1064(-)
MASCAGHSAARPRRSRVSRTYRHVCAANFSRARLYEEQAQHLSAALRCGRALAAAWPAAGCRWPGQRHGPKKVRRRPARAPQKSDDAASGWLTASEFLTLAFAAGFRGDDVTWMDTFERLCKEHGCDPAEGVSKAAFMKLLIEGFASRSLHVGAAPMQAEELGSASPPAGTPTSPNQAAAQRTASLCDAGSQATAGSAAVVKATRPRLAAKAPPCSEQPDGIEDIEAIDSGAATHPLRQDTPSKADVEQLSRRRIVTDARPEGTSAERADTLQSRRDAGAVGISCSALHTRSSSLSATVAATGGEGSRRQTVSMRFDEIPATFPSWPFK